MRFPLATLVAGMLFGGPLVFACMQDVPRTAARPNVLLVVADDLGVDRVGCYQAHPDPGHTPVIDSLAANGLLFRNVWSEPLCSPTRATLLTGRYCFRTGLGTVIKYTSDTAELPRSPATLAELLRPDYATAAVGKWHLSAAHGTGPRHPQLCGFQHFRGSMQALPDVVDAYSDWNRTVDGRTARSTTYATTSTVDDAIELLGDMRAPWFLFVAFNAPHSPFHKPPAALHSFDLPADIAGHIPIHMQAMTEALDTELGRLLASLTPEVRANTVIIFLGDNGTDQLATTAPFFAKHAKATVYEGGIHVPLIVSGPGIVRGVECSALVNTTDIFATILQLTGRAGTAEDSVSMVPYFEHPELPSIRSWVYADTFSPNGTGPWPVWRRAVRGERFKLISVTRNERTGAANELLFDLAKDPYEQQNLLGATPLGADAQAALATLRGVLAGLKPPTR